MYEKLVTAAAIRKDSGGLRVGLKGKFIFYHTLFYGEHCLSLSCVQHCLLKNFLYTGSLSSLCLIFFYSFHNYYKMLIPIVGTGAAKKNKTQSLLSSSCGLVLETEKQQITTMQRNKYGLLDFPYLTLKDTHTDMPNPLYSLLFHCIYRILKSYIIYLFTIFIVSPPPLCEGDDFCLFCSLIDL